jgi:hypothetical protein
MCNGSLSLDALDGLDAGYVLQDSAHFRHDLLRYLSDRLLALAERFWLSVAGQDS